MAPDNEFEEDFYNAITELPEVKERRDGADPSVDNCRFPWTHEDCELLFHAQDKFVVANANTLSGMIYDVFTMRLPVVSHTTLILAQ